MSSIEEIVKQANDYFYNAEYKKALSLYYQILSEDLENSGSYYNIGLAYEMLNEFELAVSYYKKSVRINNNIRSINNLARIYIDVIKNHDIAKEYLDFAIKTAPNDAEAYNLYGNLSCIENDLKLAENYFKKSIFLDENFFKNYYDIANVYYLQKDKENAHNMINKCISLKPDFLPPKELAEKINSL